VNHTTEGFGTCPECGRPITVTIDAEEVPVAVGHTLPECDRFVRMDADGYLLWAPCGRAEPRRSQSPRRLSARAVVIGPHRVPWRFLWRFWFTNAPVVPKSLGWRWRVWLWRMRIQGFARAALWHAMGWRA
jgi:hypothetical protein